MLHLLQTDSDDDNVVEEIERGVGVLKKKKKYL